MIFRDKPGPHCEARVWSRIGLLFFLLVRCSVRPAVPLGKERRHILAVFILPVPAPVVHVAPAHRSAPEQEAQAAEDQEQQEQRDQAAQQAETKPEPEEGMPVIHHRGIPGRYPAAGPEPSAPTPGRCQRCRHRHRCRGWQRSTQLQPKLSKEFSFFLLFEICGGNHNKPGGYLLRLTFFDFS